MNCMPRKRCLKPTDELFKEGDEVTLSYLRKQFAFDEDCEECLHRDFKEFTCLEHGCSQRFNSVFTYESHYNTNHRYVCIKCKKVLPSNHLLSLHIQEKHDSFFKAKLERDPTNMFQCIVEGCPDTFSDPLTRKDHVIRIHKYPANFRFGNLVTVPHNFRRTENHMETEETKNIMPTLQIEKLPKKVCFGYGSVKAFQWNKKTKVKTPISKPENVDIDMTDMQNVLNNL